jgi:methionyl-tRNA synthetase
MLHGTGFPDNQMPQLLVHGWWNLGGAKMSKSAGNIIDPFALADKYGAEALRYYLMSDIATGKDADFSEERLVERYNSNLANSLGNLLNRSLPMMARYQNGQLTKASPRSLIDIPGAPEFAMPGALKTFQDAFAKLEVSAALKEAIGLANFCDFFIDFASPWKLAKSSNQKDKTVLNDVLYSLAESLRIIAILISPVLPRAAHGIFDQLNWKIELSGKEERFSLADAEWGRLPDGHVVGKPLPLFPRIES